MKNIPDVTKRDMLVLLYSYFYIKKFLCRDRENYISSIWKYILRVTLLLLPGRTDITNTNVLFKVQACSFHSKDHELLARRCEVSGP